MNWTIIIIETIILTAAFTAMILIPLVKNPVWWIADYPIPGTEHVDDLIADLAQALDRI